MGRQAISPVDYFPGSVTLAYPLSYPQYAAWQDTLDELVGERESLTFGEIATDHHKAARLLPAIIGMVERWELRGEFPTSVTPLTFPAAPREPAARLFIWLCGEIHAIVTEGQTIPNA